MKIKIKKLPKMKHGGFFHMPFAGSIPTNPFGLISSDTTNLDKTYNDSVKPIEEDKANMEAEKGEVLFKFDAGGIFKIAGKKHYEGGTPLKADAGDFIFSDDKKLAISKKEAEVFNLKLSSKNRLNTPAKVLAKEVDLKQYNKFLTILNDPKADNIAKTTAELMLSKYMEKIGQIGFLQEGKKGFPQGLPEFAQGTAPVHADEIVHERDKAPMFKFGGFVQMQKGGNWGTWKGDKLSTFKKKFGITNAADKINDLDLVAANVGYDGPKDNLAFQKWLYESSPENKAIIDRWHNEYEDPMLGAKTRNRFDGKIGVRWDNALFEIMQRRRPQPEPMQTIPGNPIPGYRGMPMPEAKPIPKQTVTGRELPFQGFNIGMNGMEVLSGISPYLSALAQPTYYDMLTQKYSPNIRLDRLNNTEEVNNLQQQSSLAQREMFSNLSGQTAALASSDVRANEAQGIGRSNAQINNANTQIANQESLINYETDQRDNIFNLQNVHQTYNNNVLARQRRNEQLTNGALGSMNNFMAIQNNLDTLNQQATAAVLPYLTTVDTVDKDGNPIKVQVPPITLNQNRMPVPTGYGSFDAPGVAALANAPSSDDYKSAFEYFIGKGASIDEATKAATIIFYGRSGQKNAGTYAPSNPYAAALSGLYKF